MAHLTVSTDTSKSYFTPSDALTDQGFAVKETRHGLVAEKEGKKYDVVSYDHYNTTVYSVKLMEVKFYAR